MHFDLEIVYFKGFEFKRWSFSDFGQRSLELNILKAFLSETNRLLTIFVKPACGEHDIVVYSNLLITRTGINSQMSLKFGCIVHFALELFALGCLNSLALEGLNSPYFGILP